MHYHWLVPLFAALANFVIGALVLRHGVRDRLHRAFAWAAVTMVVWNLGIFSLYYFADAVRAEWYSRVFRTGLCFSPVALLHLTLLLVGCWTPQWRAVVAAGYMAGVALSIANLRGALVKGLSPHVWGWYIEPTPLYSAFSLLLLVYIPLSVERAWWGYRHPTSPRQRAQAKLWLLAVGLGAPLTLTNLLPAYGINFYPLGNFGNVLFTGIVAYAIVRHRLMDVDYVVRKGVSFALAAVVVLLPCGIGLAFLLRALAIEEPFVPVLASVAIALVAAVIIPTLRRALETRLHRALFPQLYDYRRRLGELAGKLGHQPNQSQLVVHLGDALLDILDVDGCQVFVRDEETHRLTLEYPAHEVSETLDDRLALGLEDLREPVLTDEIEASNPERGLYFRTRRWEVGIPLYIDRRLLGFVALGQKRDFRIFSAEDLHLLDAVASGASVALENSRLSRQLRRSESVLEQANRLSSLGTLAAGIAHEIRNPLVAVKTFLDLLPQRLDDPGFVTQFRDLSLSELRRVTDLIADLLALGKSSAAARRAVVIEEVLEPVVRLMESTARKRLVTIEVLARPALPLVWADPDQVKQIVLNLLLNAIDASPAQGKVSLSFRRSGTSGVLLEVHDQGSGIPASQLEHIFDPFFTTKETGTGLGLALVRQMVLEHGGDISVESEAGRGTSFRVTLPVVQSALAPAGTSTSTSPAVASS